MTSTISRIMWRHHYISASYICSQPLGTIGPLLAKSLRRSSNDYHRHPLAFDVRFELSILVL